MSIDTLVTYGWTFPYLPFTIGLARITRLSVAQRWLLGTVLLGILAEAASSWMAKIYGNNMTLTHVYTGLEGLFLIQVFYSGYPTLMRETWVRIIQVGYTGFVLCNSLLWQDWFTYGSNVRLVEGIMISTLGIWFYFQVLKRIDVWRIEQHPLFWVSMGTLCYFTGNFLNFVYSEFVFEQTMKVFSPIWAIHAGLVLILYLAYSIALLCPPKVQPSPNYS